MSRQIRSGSPPNSQSTPEVGDLNNPDAVTTVVVGGHTAGEDRIALHSTKYVDFAGNQDTLDPIKAEAQPKRGRLRTGVAWNQEKLHWVDESSETSSGTNAVVSIQISHSVYKVQPIELKLVRFSFK